MIVKMVTLMVPSCNKNQWFIQGILMNCKFGTSCMLYCVQIEILLNNAAIVSYSDMQSRHACKLQFM